MSETFERVHIIGEEFSTKRVKSASAFMVVSDVGRGVILQKLVFRKSPPSVLIENNLYMIQELTAGQLPYTINFITCPQRDWITHSIRKDGQIICLFVLGLDLIRQPKKF